MPLANAECIINQWRERWKRFLTPPVVLKLKIMKKKIGEESARLEAILAPHRSIALDALTDIMIESLEDVARFLNADENAGLDGWEFDRDACGFRQEQLEKVFLSGGGDRLLHWVAGMQEQDRLSLLMAFLNWDRLRMNDFRAKYPNSFLKWAPADDEALLEMYKSGSSWRTLSDHFGRNVNAIKLRLQRLGIDLGTEAGRPRFPQRPVTSGQARSIESSISSNE